MQNSANLVVCDGCGLPASPEHIAERLARLERATRFRPVHMNVLFVALAPNARPEEDFYGPPQSNKLFDSLMDALEIDLPAADTAAHLAEFQRKGFYQSFLSECPLPDGDADRAAAISRLNPALIRRIRFNYKPKHIALLGTGIAALIEILERCGIGTPLLLDGGQPFRMLEASDLSAGAGLRTALRAALSAGAPSQNRLSDYDRMRSNQA